MKDKVELDVDTLHFFIGLVVTIVVALLWSLVGFCTDWLH